MVDGAGRYLEGLSPAALSALDKLLASVESLDRQGFQKMLSEAARGRLEFAESFFMCAQTMSAGTEIEVRNAISRAYYAMHHAARATIFATRRFDIRDHDKVIENLPRDLPNTEDWKKLIGRWKVKREAADYSPYWDDEEQIETLREEALSDAKDFLAVCAEYLRKREEAL